MLAACRNVRVLAVDKAGEVVLDVLQHEVDGAVAVVERFVLVGKLGCSTTAASQSLEPTTTSHRPLTVVVLVLGRHHDLLELDQVAVVQALEHLDLSDGRHRQLDGSRASVLALLSSQVKTRPTLTPCTSLRLRIFLMATTSSVCLSLAMYTWLRSHPAPHSFAQQPPRT